MTGRVSVLSWVVAGLTATGFVLRLAGIDQSLMGDELSSYRIAAETRLPDIPGAVADNSITPPLHYLLAGVSSRFGEASVSVRLPSLLLGTAAIPLVYALGSRTVGRAAGCVGAGLVALAPFAIYFGVENRAYATLVFLSALSTLALLNALRLGRWIDWLGYAVSATVILYTHYTGLWVLAGQFAWALWTRRDRARGLILANVGIAVAFIPWLPSYLDQQDLASEKAADFVGRWPLSASTLAGMAAHALPGYPLVPPGGTYVPLRDIPGIPALALFVAVITVALATSAFRAWRRLRAGGPPIPSTHALILTLALVTPVGMALYSLQPEKSLLLSRNLSASLPAIALVVGSAVCSLPRRVAIAAVALLFASLLVGTTKTFDPDYARPAYREAAHLIDDRAAAGDLVVQPLLDGAESAGNPTLPPHFQEPHSVFMTSEPVDAGAAASIERQAGLAKHVFVVAASPIAHATSYWRAPLAAGFRPIRRQEFAGVIPLTVLVFETMTDRAPRLVSRPGPDLLTTPGRPPLPVAVPGTGRGAGNIDTETAKDGVLEIGGWAVDQSTRRPAESVLAFSGGRATAAAVPATFRPDIAAIYGKSAGPSGFSLAASVRDTAASSPLRVIAMTRGRAWELPRP